MRHFLMMNITNSVNHIDYMFNTKCVIDVNIWGVFFFLPVSNLSPTTLKMNDYLYNIQ
jgi:hypothetical protein